LLHRPAVQVIAPATATPVEPKVQDLVDIIYAEAGKSIASFLAVDVDALSQPQIAQGRNLLVTAQQQHVAWSLTRSRGDFELLAGTVQDFYNAIPTQLSSRIERDQVVLDFCNALAEHEDRLKQLEAALATANARQRNPQVSLYDALGAQVALLAQNDRRYSEICDYIDRTLVHGYRVRVRDIFAVVVPDERRAFEQNTCGRGRIERLFHGTANQNVCHILRSGLICPRVASHGRMFGDGIYFANKCTKSTNYCSVSRRGVPHMLFLADVALGKPFVAKEAMTGLKAAPAGHDSVWGKAGHTGSWGSKLQFDEFIVYNTAQQTLRYLVTFDR
jgi:poly [ADP-ribose] polymerase